MQTNSDADSITLNLIEKITEFADGAQLKFRELVTDLSKFNEIAAKKLAVIGQERGELI